MQITRRAFVSASLATGLLAAMPWGPWRPRVQRSSILYDLRRIVLDWQDQHGPFERPDCIRLSHELWDMCFHALQRHERWSHGDYPFSFMFKGIPVVEDSDLRPNQIRMVS